MPPVEAILIAGPTASGKSAFALDLAERFGGMVVNADSMQVYRELTILTARPSASETARAAHALYGHVPAAEPYSVGRWLADVAQTLARARSSGHVPILVGGTGLYFSALLEGLSPVVPIPPEVRTYWRSQAERLGPQRLHQELAARDPRMAARLRTSDPQRVTRALEVIEGTGRSLADWQGQAGTPLIEETGALRLVIAPSRQTLYARCDARFEAMLGAGAVAEAAAFARLGLPGDLPASRATGLRELVGHVRGEISLQAAATAAKAATRRYAKRQMTWIRGRMAGWTVLETGDAQATTAVARQLEERGVRQREASAPCVR